MKFERQIRRVLFLENDNVYRVTYDSIRKESRNPKDPEKHLVGIATAVNYWDIVARRKNCLACARTIKAAWNAGDRYLLDTDEARRAAELVSDLSDSKPDENDICSALSDLMNAIAAVRLSNTTVDDFEILPVIRETFERCVKIEGFDTWTSFSKRRRFLYELPRKYRTPVVYTLMSLYFGQGAYPILTSKQRQELQAFERGEGVEEAVTYLDNCLRKITAYRFA